MDAGVACGQTEGGVGSSALFRRVSRQSKALDVVSAAIPADAKRRQEQGISEINQDGGQKIIVFGPVEKSGWSLGLVISQSEYKVPIQKMRNMIIFLTLLSIALITVVILTFVRRYITKPINWIVLSLADNAGSVLEASNQVSAMSKFLAEESSIQEASLTNTSASVEASQETQKLIKGIINKITAEAGQVKETDDKYRNVALSVQKVAELIKEISIASREQATGVEQLNKSILEMEKMIQQTAANAEESAATSADMHTQAEQMQMIVTQLNEFIKGSQEIIDQKLRNESVDQRFFKNLTKNENPSFRT